MKNITLLLLLVFFIFSCKKNDFNKITSGEWNPNFAVPLAHSVFDVYDVFENSDEGVGDLIVIDENSGLLALNYKSEFNIFNAHDYIQIEDYGFTETLSIQDLGGTSSSDFLGTISYQGSEVIDLEVDDALLTEVKFEKGDLLLDLDVEFQHPTTIIVSIPEFSKNGTVFTKVIDVPANTFGASIQEDLKGYIYTSGSIANQLEVTYDVEITGDGGSIDDDEVLKLEFTLANLGIDYAKGYIGMREVDLSEDSIFLKIFDASTDGYFELMNPQIRFTVINSIGAPIELNIDQVTTVDVNTNTEHDLLGYSETHLVNYPSSMGDSSKTEIVFDENNTSNMDQVISPTPKYIEAKASAKINPDGNLGEENFLTKDSKLRVESEVELPLYGLAYNFKLKDTVEFNLDENADFIEKIMFRLIAVNGFPINVIGKITFMDENYQPLFSITNPDGSEEMMLLKAGFVNSDGEVIEPVKTISDLTLTQEQIEVLDKVAFLELSGEANTKDFEMNQKVKIFDYYELDLHLGVQVIAKF